MRGSVPLLVVKMFMRWSILASVAHHLDDSTMAFAENCTCEGSRSNEVYDGYFPGQSVIVPMKECSNGNLKSYTIQHYWPDGSSLTVSPANLQQSSAITGFH